MAARGRKVAGRKGKRRILVVDDHPVLREGLVQIIDRQSDLCVCGTAESATEAIERVDSLEPDLAIVDLSLKEGSGLDLIGDLIRKPSRPPVLVLSMHDESVYAERALKAGARGYIMKEEAPESLVGAIHMVLKGGIFLSERMRVRLGR
ncbi:MAG: response regulator transcription factor [Gemmatimonadota bacterium]